MEYEVRNLPSELFILEDYLGWHNQAPVPNPEPRPPEESFPKPFKPFNTYSGWKAPAWFVWTGTWVPQTCTLDEDCLVTDKQDVREIIMTFTTDDSS